MSHRLRHRLQRPRLDVLLGEKEAAVAVAENRYESREQVGHGGKAFTEYKYKEQSESKKEKHKVKERVEQRRKATAEDKAALDVHF